MGHMGIGLTTSPMNPISGRKEPTLQAHLRNHGLLSADVAGNRG